MAKTRVLPKKPFPDFPLFAHKNGQWCKKIRGKLHDFDTDADAALTKYLAERDDLQVGRHPRTTPNTTLSEMVNQYLTDADERRTTGE